MSNYFNMNEVQVGTKVKIIKSGLTGLITEVFHFPTTFKVEFEDSSFKIYKTHEVELLLDDELEGSKENE